VLNLFSILLDVIESSFTFFGVTCFFAKFLCLRLVILHKTLFFLSVYESISNSEIFIEILAFIDILIGTE